MKKFNLLPLAVGGFFVGFLALLLLSTYIVDDKKLYAEFVKEAKIEVTNPDKVVFKVDRLPFLTLTIDEIKQDGKLELKNVEIKFSLLSLLKFNYQISDIKIGQLSLHLSNDDVNFLEHDEFISELIRKEALNISAKVEKLVFIESDKDIPLIIENFFFQGSNKSSAFSGEVKWMGSLKGDFTKNGDLIDFHLNIDSPDHKIMLQENYQQSVLKNGKLSIITTKPVENLTKFLPEFSISDKIESDEEILINCDIEPSNNSLNLKNITISSNKSVEGKGEMTLSKNKDDISEVKISFNKLNLENWLKNKNSNSSNVNEKINRTVNKHYSFTKKKINANINADQVKLNAENLLNGVKLNLSTQDGKVNIDEFSGTINQNGQFKVAGSFSQNPFRTIFKGQIALAHEDLNDLVQLIGEKNLGSSTKVPYALTSDIKFSSVDVSLQNLLIKTNEIQIFGSFSTKFIGNSPRTNANLKFTKVNLDDKNFPILFQIYEYGKALVSDSKKEDYLNKFIPLRKISAINNYDLAFDQVVLNGKLYRNVSFNLDLSPGRLRVENLTLKYDENYVNASLDLLASGVKPIFNIIVHDGNLGVDFLSPSGFLELRKFLLDTIALDKIDLNMSCAFSNIHQNNFQMNRVFFKAKNKNNLFEISDFNGDLLGGRLTSSGSVLLDPYTINFVYALNSASVDEISKILPDGMINKEGFVSLNGMWSTNGNSLEEQLYNLYTKSNFVGKDLVLSNFSIDDMIETLNTPRYNINNLKDDVKKALLTGNTAINQIKTSIELSKGMINLEQMELQTKYSTGGASAIINIYDFTINLSAIFSYYVNKSSPGKAYLDKTATSMTVNATGSLFTPKKEADTKLLEELLNPTIVKSK